MLDIINFSNITLPGTLPGAFMNQADVWKGAGMQDKEKHPTVFDAYHYHDNLSQIIAEQGEDVFIKINAEWNDGDHPRIDLTDFNFLTNHESATHLRNAHITWMEDNYPELKYAYYAEPSRTARVLRLRETGDIQDWFQHMMHMTPFIKRIPYAMVSAHFPNTTDLNDDWTYRWVEKVAFDVELLRKFFDKPVIITSHFRHKGDMNQNPVPLDVWKFMLDTFETYECYYGFWAWKAETEMPWPHMFELAKRGGLM